MEPIVVLDSHIESRSASPHCDVKKSELKPYELCLTKRTVRVAFVKQGRHVSHRTFSPNGGVASNIDLHSPSELSLSTFTLKLHITILLHFSILSSFAWWKQNKNKLRILTCDHLVLPDRYNDRVEEHLRLTGFYHVSQIGVVQCQKALVNALIERWHPDTHTFHLPIGECAVTLEDVAIILGLLTDGLPVTGMTMSSFEALEAECLHQFRVALCKSDCRGSCINGQQLMAPYDTWPQTI
ncbi:hypothetical protein Ahy_B10g105690 [Arachis hypogaea]|uniref:Aminotransferase-like plant mobile domain-containing protein n=1 Tax=Arachis hypogaea TaxID=3818 RepID=A0A444X8L2_ARAHY|nr:hypothetical protein Ahy_B10g105690 [Arachis hypogaea]